MGFSVGQRLSLSEILLPQQLQLVAAIMIILALVTLAGLSDSCLNFVNVSSSKALNCCNYLLAECRPIEAVHC